MARFYLLASKVEENKQYIWYIMIFSQGKNETLSQIRSI